MIDCSAEFKALWYQKIGRVEARRIRYKRRYRDVDGEWVNEADWKVLKEGDFKGIGRISGTLDATFRNVFRIGNASLSLPNLYNELMPGAAFWQADETGPDGYVCYKSLFQVQRGYRLADGTWEWLSVFTGVALRVRPTGSGADAVIEVAAKTALLARAEAEEVRDTDVTLENCIPATGDDSNTDFESTSVGVDHGTDLQVNAGSLTPGSGWKTSNENQLAAAGNTGRLAIKLAAAPAAGHTVKVSLVKWLRDQTIGALLGLLFDVAGIPEAERSIAPFVFPGGVSSSVGVDEQAEWEAGSLLTGIDTELVENSALKRYHVDYLNDLSAWTVASGSWAATDNVLTGSGGISVPYTHAGTLMYYQWVANVGTVTGPFGHQDGQTEFVILGSAASPGNGYALRVGCSGSALGGPTTSYALVRYDAGVATILADGTVSSTDNGSHTWRIHRTAGGLITVYKDGAALLSATDTTYTAGSYVSITADYSTDFSEIQHDDQAAVTYESAEYDLLETPISMGTLSVSATLNGGSIVASTNAAAVSGVYDGWVERDSVTNAIESTARRFFKAQIVITPSTTPFVSPRVTSWLADFMTTQVFVSLANHRGKKCLAQVERYLRLSDYEMAVRGDGVIAVRAKTVSAEPAVTLTQGNGLLDVTAYDEGIPDRCVRGGQVRYGEFVSRWTGVEAGASAAVLAQEEEIGGVIVEDDISDVALALNANLAGARAVGIYENSRRAADDPRPLRRLRIRMAYVPWLELSDVVRLAFYDNPYMRQFLAADPLHRAGPYYNMGDPVNILARDEDFKVIEYIPDHDTDEAEALVEEIPA